MMLRQVLLRRPVEGGHAEDVYWIDNALAVRGRQVRDEAGTIWTIAEVYGARDRGEVELSNDAQRHYAEVLDG